MIYTSPYPSVAPERQYTGGIFNFIFGPKSPNFVENKVALVDALTGKETTYGQLRSASLRLASGLTQTAGLKRGQTILIFSPNSTLYPALLFAGQAAGLTVSTANAGYTPSELAHQLEVSGASVVLAATELLETTEKAVKEVGLRMDQVFVLPDAKGEVPKKLPDGARSWGVLNGNEDFKPVAFTEKQAKEDIAYLPFSSGTTGKGKGVALSSLNCTSCILQTAATKELFDRAWTGGKLIILPKFDLVPALEAIQKYRCTTALIVPPVALALAKHPIVDKYDLSSIRFILSGAAPLSASLQEAVAARLKFKVVQGLGMSETTSVSIIPDISNVVKPGSVGKLLSTMEARLVDPDGRDVREGESGELWVRGPNVMLRYHRNEEATRETLTEDGWLKTGDICERDSDGHYFVVDRSKDLIKYKGFQVAPAEVEGVLLTCPLVADAAVIGIWSDEQATELPRAYIVPNAEHSKSASLTKDVAKYVEERLAPHKRLRGGVIIVEAIPKSPSGKILKKDLRTLAAKDAGSKAKL